MLAGADSTRVRYPQSAEQNAPTAKVTVASTPSVKPPSTSTPRGSSGVGRGRQAGAACPMRRGCDELLDGLAERRLVPQRLDTARREHCWDVLLLDVQPQLLE